MSKKMEKLYAEHEKEIVKKYGKVRAEKANYGWAQGENFISTKVYGKPAMVVTSRIHRGSVNHSHERY